jgi:integrating conjugative element protein (TIGR03758 family)
MLPAAVLRFLPPALAGLAFAAPAVAYNDAAFQAGSGYSGLDLALAIAMLVAAIVILWVAWLSIGAFLAWERGHETAVGAASAILRGCLIIVVVGYFIR